ncbi:MAG: hypothetical protein EBV42_02920 [Actinobacteria bacterium]|nr:hypothetical protein [Actinomycetota bacterium]
MLRNSAVWSSRQCGEVTHHDPQVGGLLMAHAVRTKHFTGGVNSPEHWLALNTHALGSGCRNG